MGAYQLFKITFKSKEARDWFENNLKDIQKPKRRFQNQKKDVNYQKKIRKIKELLQLNILKNVKLTTFLYSQELVKMKKKSLTK